MRRIPASWKRVVARLVRWRSAQHLMRWGIRLLVPRHRIGVSLVAINDERQVFMLQHVFHPYTPWGLPGGWMSGREAPADGLRRELREETGLTARIGPVVQVYRDPRSGNFDITYLGCLEPGPVVLSAEILEAAWFAIDQLPSPLYPSTLRAIHRALSIHHTLPEENW